jgi:hypothetical protein
MNFINFYKIKRQKTKSTRFYGDSNEETAIFSCFNIVTVLF